MSRATLTPAAKAQLASTIRGLRERLLGDLVRLAESEYLLSVPAAQAKLPEARRRRRATLEAWLDERQRAARAGSKASAAERRAGFLRDAVKEVGATWLNRLVLLKHLEALELSKPKVVTGGWESPGYRRFRQFGPALLSGSETEGYGLLLQLLFEEHAVDLPGLFGEVGLERLFPLPAATLRELVEKLDDKGLESAWTDDTTLGWVYQYWNDPEREALDRKIADGGKIEPGEIASKTQMFTERYMVEWLLHNSLGPTWLALCEKNGWTADARKVLPELEARRVAFRAERDAGRVAPDALMLIENELEDHWKYYVPQPLSADAIEKAPSSIADLKLLDPACGSGHFLVIAFDLLAAMYREEARHRGPEAAAFSDRQIAERILENNLFGVDIDPRAVQIAAAALFLKARLLARDAHPARLNLVAPALKLGNLPADDPAVTQIQQALWQECGIPQAASARLFHALAGVDHLGSLLKVDTAIGEVIAEAETFQRGTVQQDLFDDGARRTNITKVGSRQSILEKLETFLASHSSVDDLGLRLDGAQLAAGVRFVRILHEGRYDVVVGNPPYQGTSKMADAAYVAKTYKEGKADLYAAFLLRGLELAKPGGCSALLTMRGWMFLGQSAELRKRLLRENELRLIGDVDRGAFADVPDEVLSVVMTVMRRLPPSGISAVAMQPTALADHSRDSGRTNRKRAALLAQVGRYEFDVRGFGAIEGEPVVYWWLPRFITDYASCPKLGEAARIRYGLSTQNNTRWLRKAWEVFHHHVMKKSFVDPPGWDGSNWVPYIKGAEGRIWFDAVSDVLNWANFGLELATYPENRYGRGTTYYFKRGVAFVNIGASFSARVHRRQSIFGHVAGSVFDVAVAAVLCMLNSAKARFIMESLNPGVHFLTTDVERLPILGIESADDIYATLDRAFTEHEAAREASVEFRRPGPSPWRYVQEWAQRSVDRPAGEPLPAYEAAHDPAPPVAFVSYAFGVAMGRFGAEGEGILDDAPAAALPGGILFSSARADEGAADSLSHPACAPLRAAWDEHGASVGEGDDLRTYLRKSFFAHVKDTYENRPIYFPLSSKQKNFVAWVSIHRFHAGGKATGASALQTLLADHLVPERRAIDAELEELRGARTLGEGKQRAAAEKRYERMRKLGDELDELLASVARCADKGPPRIDREPEREVDARYAMDLDDGVMVNAAALWPLLEPQWKDPKKWWKELVSAQGRKDYDWSHLAARYFPARVAAKCVDDPSLAVAHGCFWRLHPAKAHAWELRLQDEIRPDFTIDEPGSDEARARFLADHAAEAAANKAKEQLRRERKAAKKEDDELPGLGEGDDEKGEPGAEDGGKPN